MSVVSCPCCSESQEVSNEHHQENKRYEQECSQCGEIFQLSVEITYQYKVYCPADKHNMQKAPIAERNFFYCTLCDFSEVRR